MGAGIVYRSDKNGGLGLRTPQIGALHAIAAQWSVSSLLKTPPTKLIGQDREKICLKDASEVKNSSNFG